MGPSHSAESGAAGGVDGVGLAFAALPGGSKLHGNQKKGQSAHSASAV